MKEIKINYIVIGHHSREEQAMNLATELDAIVLIDNADHGANWSHRRAIELAMTLDGQTVFVEDDAVPVAYFKDKVTHWISKYPDSLISFYLGTGRPKQYQPLIQQQIEHSVTDFIVFKKLIHGVCYTIPKSGLQRVLDLWHTKKPADFAVSHGWNGLVIYPKKSLVDHMDLLSVEVHPDNEPRTEIRRAWMLDE